MVRGPGRNPGMGQKGIHKNLTTCPPLFGLAKLAELGISSDPNEIHSAILGSREFVDEIKERSLRKSQGVKEEPRGHYVAWLVVSILDLLPCFF